MKKDYDESSRSEFLSRPLHISYLLEQASQQPGIHLALVLWPSSRTVSLRRRFHRPQ
jgi:hypothetical protein